jgi:tetrahydromethanopterin S-methyltransferase subunit H
LFRFERPQEIIQIGGLTIGGQPGEFPTVLIGSIFYDRHRIVEDPKKGKFDAEQGLELIRQLEEISEKTGNPFMLDVVGNTPEALKKYIDFVAENCDVPFLVDSSSVHTRLQAMKHAINVGLRGRSIYNSIDYHTNEEELSFIAEIGVESAVLMAFNPKDLRPEGRLKLLTGNSDNAGLVEKAQKAGIEKLLVDTAVLDLPSIGLSARTILLVKERLGLPCGCAPSNAVSSWERCKEDYGDIGFKSCRASANAMPIYFGADYTLFGPISYANEVFPVCAMADALVAYTSRYLGTNIQTSNHPLRRIF